MHRDDERLARVALRQVVADRVCKLPQRELLAHHLARQHRLHAGARRAHKVHRACGRVRGGGGEKALVGKQPGRVCCAALLSAHTPPLTHL
jgi:hypothetical protein